MRRASEDLPLAAPIPTPGVDSFGPCLMHHLSAFGGMPTPSAQGHKLRTNNGADSAMGFLYWHQLQQQRNTQSLVIDTQKTGARPHLDRILH